MNDGNAGNGGAGSSGRDESGAADSAAAGEPGNRRVSPVEELGSAAEEAAKLFEALGEWASTRASAASGHIATGSPECSLCPICQAIRALRLARPEVMHHLGEVVGSLVAGVRAAIEAAERQRAADRDRDHSGRSERLQHIDID